MREQANLAIAMADVILFLTDIKQGVTAADREISIMLKKSGKPIVLVCNKADNFQKDKEEAYEFYNLGMGDPYPISATNALGIGDVLDKIYESFPENIEENKEKLSKIINNKLEKTNKLDKKILEKLNWKYKNEELTKIASKMSVSEIKKNKSSSEDKQEIIMQTPKFIAEEKVSASRKGTLIHLCMQRLDYRKEYTYSDLKEMVAELEAKKIITSLEAENININKVLNFTKSKIYEELKTAKLVEKEKPYQFR